MAADVGMNFRDRSQDNTRSGFEKREKRRRIRKLQDAISQKKYDLVTELLQEEFDVDFQYRGQTALQLAVREGLYDICKSLIEKGANVNKTDSDMNNLLNMACWRDYESIACLLIQNEADINAQNDHGCTPLNTCAYKGCANISKQLLSANCDPDIANTHGRSPLHTAAKQRHTNIVDILQKSGCKLNLGDEDLKTPLCIAAELGYADVVKSLLIAGADPDIQDKGKRTPVYNAAVQGHLEVIRELVQGKANMNIATAKGSTPLLEAINNNFIEVAELLIDSRCNIDQKDRLHQAPVHAAIRQVSQVFGPETEKALSLVKKILESGCDVNLVDSQGWSPLYQAAFAGNQEITRMLLDRKADITLKTKNGGTVLHAGTMGNTPAVVDMLISAGCDVNETNDNNESPLFCAITSHASMQILQSLLKAGSNLNQREKAQQLTPLHEAVLQHYTQAAVYFIDSGCDVNAVNLKFQTPLYLAAEKGNDVVVERILKEAKCLVNGIKPTTIPLHVAAVNNHANIAQMLIKSGCSLNKMNEKCLTPIMHATEENSPDVAKVLLKYGCDLNAHAKIKRFLPCCMMNEDPHPHFGLEPVFLAVTHKNIDLVKLFIKCYYTIPYSVIKNLSNILRTSRDMNSQFSQSQKKDFIELFENTLRYPRSLQEICRAEIREYLGSKPESKVQGLTVAKKLQDYILMTDTFEEELEPSKEERKTGRFGMINL